MEKSEFFLKKYVGESFLSPIITYDKMRTYYHIQKLDFRFQEDLISPKRTRLFEEYDEKPVSTTFYIILTKHRKIKLIFILNLSVLKLYKYIYTCISFHNYNNIYIIIHI